MSKQTGINTLQDTMINLFSQLSETDKYILIAEAKELLQAAELHEKYSHAQIYQYKPSKKKGDVSNEEP